MTSILPTTNDIVQKVCSKNFESFPNIFLSIILYALMQSVLVTGGAGFIGQHLVRRLLKDYKVIIIDNLSSGQANNIPRHQNVAFYNEDIRNGQAIQEIVTSQKIETCIHLAAITASRSPASDLTLIDVNVKGTANILDSCFQSGIKRFIFASSAAVYGEANTRPVSEDHKINPISAYGKSKAEGEKLIASYLMSGKIAHAIILRIFNAYGEGQNPRYAAVIAKFGENLSKGLPPVVCGGKQTRDFVSVNDVVRAILLAMQSDVSSTFNIGTGKATTINDLAKEIINVFGLGITPSYEKIEQCNIVYSCADIRKARKVLKFVAKDELHNELIRLYGKHA